MNKKAALSNAAIVALVLVVAAAFIFQSDIRNWISPQSTVKNAELEVPVTTTTAGLVACQQQTDGTNTIGFAIKNALSSTLDYDANNVYFVSATDGILTNKTTSSGTQLSYTSADVIPCEKGTMYVIGGKAAAAGAVSTMADFDTFSMNKNFVIQSADAGAVLAYARTTAYANDNTNSSQVAADAAAAAAITQYVVNTSTAQGGNKEGYLDINVNGSNTAYGYMQQSADGKSAIPASDGVIYSVDFQNNNIYSVSNGFTLNSQTAGIAISKVACPAEVAATDSSEVCFQSRTLTASDGTVRLYYKISADLGNPTEITTDDPILRTRDKAIFQDNDGTIRLGYVTSDGTDKGAETTTVYWQLS